jgi:arylsulfatase A-like enzyme
LFLFAVSPCNPTNEVQLQQTGQLPMIPHLIPWKFVLALAAVWLLGSPDGSSELAAFLEPTAAPARRTEALLQGIKGIVLRQGDWIYFPKQGSLGYTAPEPERPFGLKWAKMGFVNSEIDDQGQIKPEAPKEQLYNLASDVRQSKNVAAEQPERLRAMRSRLLELAGPAVKKTTGATE